MKSPPGLKVAAGSDSELRLIIVLSGRERQLKWMLRLRCWNEDHSFKRHEKKIWGLRGAEKKEEGAGAGEVEHVILEEDPCQG